MQFSLFNAAAQSKWPTGSFLVMDSGGVRLAEPKEILGKAADLAAEPKVQREFFTSPRAVAALFALRLHESLEHEVFAMALVDSQHQLIEYSEPFRGTLTQAAVYPREVVKQALRANAAGVFIAHNHPSGLLEASRNDLELTKQLQKALALVDIRLLDHILVAGGQTLSFAEHGLM